VRLVGAKLGGGLNWITHADGAIGQEHWKAVRLIADSIETRDNVFLRGATVTGQVRLVGARLAIWLRGATLTAGRQATRCARMVPGSMVRCSCGLTRRAKETVITGMFRPDRRPDRHDC
jgi:hypothetical protein